MNKNTQKPKVPPSPTAIARKPLINITNVPHPNSTIQPNTISRPQSTKNIKARISIDQFSRPKLKQVHSRKNCRSDSIQSCTSMQMDKYKDNSMDKEHTKSKQNRKIIQNYCKIHKNIVAMHQIEFDNIQYFCFQCSLIYAKKGYKIKFINSNTNTNINNIQETNKLKTTNKQSNYNTNNNNNNNSNSYNNSNYHSQYNNNSSKSLNIETSHLNNSNNNSRIQQTNKYLQKCSNITSKIYTWRKQQNTAIKDIYQKYGQIINNLRNKMQIQLNKIKQIYDKQIHKTQQTRQEQIKIFKQIQIQMQKLGRVIDSGKFDVQKNYQDCIYFFNGNQYRTIMDQYWQQVTKAQSFINTNSIANLIVKCQPDIKMTVRTMQRSDNTLGQFTFSKQKKFDTPPFSKQLRGIKIVQSQPDSQRYESSLKQSVVDSKINFSQFCP